jgi:hypothetical protein
MDTGNVFRVFIATSLLIGSLVKGARAGEASPNKMECIAADTDGQKLRLVARLSEARKRFAVCAAASCPHIVREDCMQRIAEIEVAQPTVVFSATNGYGHPLLAVRVLVDGKRIADRLDERPLSVDPGDHVFLFEALGRVSATMRLSLSEGDRVHHAVVLPTASGAPVDEVPATPMATELEDPSRTDLDGSSVIVAPAGGLSAAREGMPAPRENGISSRRIAALTLGGVGVAGVVVGSIFGLMTLTKWNDLMKDCPRKVCPSAADVGRETAVATDGNISTVAFLLGAASLGAAAGLWFGSPESTRSPGVALVPVAGPSQGHLFVRARF